MNRNGLANILLIISPLLLILEFYAHKYGLNFFPFSLIPPFVLSTVAFITGLLINTVPSIRSAAPTTSRKVLSSTTEKEEDLYSAWRKLLILGMFAWPIPVAFLATGFAVTSAGTGDTDGAIVIISALLGLPIAATSIMLAAYYRRSFKTKIAIVILKIPFYFLLLVIVGAIFILGL
jgi:hypothetical protein